MQPSIGPPGGGNAVCTWMLQALSRDHDLTLLTWWPPDLDVVNRYYGTSLRRTTFREELVSGGWRALVALLPGTSAYLRRSILQRLASARARAHDLVVTAANECDLGVPGIQYVHYPADLFPRPAEDRRWYHLAPLPWLYYALSHRIARRSVSGIRANLTLTNSDWTADLMRRHYGIEAVTVPPPVRGRFEPMAWEAREESFVCIGRLSPEKRLVELVELVARLRSRRPSLRLRIIGNADNAGYARRIRRLASTHEWVDLTEDLTREELECTLPRYRYGLHGMHEEHFGIAVAEMLRAGLILFAADGGGPPEILGREGRLLYRDFDDAAEKIEAVLESSELQEELRAILARRADEYSEELFAARIRQIVARRLEIGPTIRADQLAPEAPGPA